MQATLRKLLLEIEAYLGRAGGRGPAEVLDGLVRWKAAHYKPVEARAIAPVKWVEPACALLAETGEPNLAATILAATPNLRWVTYDAYTRASIGEAFADNHSFASIIGEEGPILSRDFEVGLFIIAPNVFYRDHRHAAPELYAPLTGPHGWRFSPTDPLVWKDAHQPVWNEPYRPHAMKTGDVPFLAVFVWTRDVNAISVVIPADDWPAMEQSGPPR